MDPIILPRPKRGRPKRQEEVTAPIIKPVPVPSPELSLQQNAYQMMTYYHDPLSAYLRAGATQFSATDSIQSIFHKLLHLKQIHFSGVPFQGDLAFFSKDGILIEVGMISRLDLATNKLFLVKPAREPIETYPVDRWYALGKIVR